MAGQNTPIGYNWIMENVGHQDDECLLWPFRLSTPGYAQFSHEKKVYLAHRYMCRLTHGDPPAPEYHAAHSCGNRRCVNPRHLIWKTQTDNQLDRRVHGTNNKARTKLTPLQAQQIRQLKGIETAIETAARYGITESNVRQIQEGKTWKVIGGKIRRALTTEQVLQIRRIGLTKSDREVADMLGVGRLAVWRVRNNKTATARQS